MMARKLSRIARCGILTVLAGAAAMLVARASAEPAVQVSSAEEVIENPFAKPSARSSAPQPVVVQPSTEGEPRNYQNPFATRDATSRMRLRVPRTGTTSRWRRPTQINGASATRQSLGTVDPNVRPAADEWDTLSPSDFRDVEPAVISALNAPQPIRSGAPPDPARFDPRPLKQPPWLMPQSPRKARSAAGHDDRQQTDEQGPGASSHVDRSADSRFGAPTGPNSQSADGPQFDPFEKLKDAAAVATSTEQNDIRTANPRDAGALYVAAQQAAEAAETPDELADVVLLCQKGLAKQPRRELAGSLRSLAAWACNRRGEMSIDAGQSRTALTEFDTAIEFDPNCWLALHNRAISRAQQGEVEPALRDFNRAIELNPGLASAYRNRGELLAAAGRTDEAIADYTRALTQLPEDAELYDIRGHALHRLGRYQEAIRDLDRAIELEPNNAETYTHRGNVYAELNDFAQAVDDLQQALAVDEQCAGAYRSLAWLMATCPDPQFRDPQHAVAAAEEAARLSPRGDPFVLDALATAYASAGQYEPAIRYQTEAIAVAPESFAAQFASRLTLYRQGRPYRNSAGNRESDAEVHAASLETPRRRRSGVKLAH